MSYQIRLRRSAARSREGLLKGGKSGPAVVPGKAADSLLIAAIERTHPRLKMPPQGALKTEEVADIRKWVDQGADWPSQTVPKPLTTSITPDSVPFGRFNPSGRPHHCQRQSSDSFLLAKMQIAGLKPAPPADKRTLLRRVTFDLTGLPPTPEEVNAFVADRSSNAFEKVVDRLLNSPHYGERWARHWLDLARYSDGRGGARDDDPYPNAFRYRDWVIDALNKDMPYDIFVKAQIAADQMPKDTRKSLLPGLGFQTIGESDNDRVDVTTRVFLGLTVGCAQCHDHKFDPIPTRDYYSMLGIFRSSKTDEYPLASAEVVEAYKKAKKVSEDKKAEVKLAIERQTTQVIDMLASQTEQYIYAAWRVISKRNEETAAKDLDPETLERWVKYLQVSQRDHKYMSPWDDLGAGKATEAEVQSCRPQDSLGSRRGHGGKKSNSGSQLREAWRPGGMKDTDKVISTLVEALPIEKFYFWRDMASGPYKVEDINFKGGIYYYGTKEAPRFLGPQWKRYIEALQDESKAAEKAIPPLYPFWHVLKDSDKPANVKIAIRGSEANLGEEAPRAFLSILCNGEPKPFHNGSGRLELANAIASPDNPLTARVMVNRIWQYHFGEGIVRSTSNFGQLGERPTHPELWTISPRVLWNRDGRSRRCIAKCS